jgi:hypothetical protein
MISESHIREHLASFLAGDESLDAFEDWLVQNSWNMHRDSCGGAQQLVAEIELRLSEYSSGHLDENALRRELRPFVEQYQASISFAGAPPSTFPIWQFLTNSDTIQLPLLRV